MNSKNLLKISNVGFSKGVLLLLFVFALLGFSDSTYLAIKHYNNSLPPCTIINGCEKVLTSKYAEFAGIPTALYGSLFYLTILVLLVLYVDLKKEWIKKSIFYLSSLGFLFSLFLIALQVFVIEAICLFCLVSATSSTALFVISGVAIKKDYSIIN